MEELTDEERDVLGKVLICLAVCICATMMYCEHCAGRRSTGHARVASA